MFKLFADFETYWDKDYTLKKLTPVEYILDPRFEALGCGFAIDDGRAWWVDGPDLPKFFAAIPWSECIYITHNALFDALIMSLKYGIRPAFYGDTMGMAQNWVTHSTGKVGLDVVAQYYGLPPKMTTVDKTKGHNLVSIKQQPELYDELKRYAIDDTLKCKTIYEKMMNSGFPVGELEVIDMVVRMAAEPLFEADKEVLHQHLAKIKADKEELLRQADMIGPDNLMSNTKLAAMLLFAGLDHVPTKISKTTGQESYAFAKTDKEFTSLLEHENPHIQALVAARLGHKSTLEETRAQRFIDLANVAPRFPIPLRYSGAHTHRFSGQWAINAQNLPRGGQLRKALRAPRGYKVVSVDASQIEARINAALSEQHDLVDAFARGKDVYAQLAEQIYKYPVNKEQQPAERQVGKVGILSLGYGASSPVFQNMCRNSQPPVSLTDSEAADVVFVYRNRYRQIVNNWEIAGKEVIPQMASGGRDIMMNWGPLKIRPNAIELPNGNRLRYRDLRHEFSEVKGRFTWLYNRGTKIKGIYGAKLVENVVQALAFVHIMEVARRVKWISSILPKHQVHDELLYIVEDHLAEQMMELVVAEMSKPPNWMPDAPLDAEGHIGVTYGDTK